MRALHHTPAEHHGNEAHISIFKTLCTRVSDLSEPIWLTITFLLFILMGPFSIIAVIYGLWSLASRDYGQKMVEPTSCSVQ